MMLCIVYHIATFRVHDIRSASAEKGVEYAAGDFPTDGAGDGVEHGVDAFFHVGFRRPSAAGRRGVVGCGRCGSAFVGKCFIGGVTVDTVPIGRIQGDSVTRRRYSSSVSGVNEDAGG